VQRGSVAPSPSPGGVGCGGGPVPASEPRLPPLQNGVISLIDCTLVEEQESTDEDGRCRGYPHPRGALSPTVGAGWGLAAASPGGCWAHRGVSESRVAASWGMRSSP